MYEQTIEILQAVMMVSIILVFPVFIILLFIPVRVYEFFRERLNDLIASITAVLTFVFIITVGVFINKENSRIRTRDFKPYDRTVKAYNIRLDDDGEFHFMADGKTYHDEDLQAIAGNENSLRIKKTKWNRNEVLILTYKTNELILFDD